MSAFYNEHDSYAAQWLRNLGAAGQITPGAVDERSIRDLAPADVADFQRAHFFAGIGVWDYALRRAGWTGPVWTGSCPCQPFSAAGKRKGLEDDRHLWPEWFRLIRECRPPVILGEQVASAGDWLDVVSRDLEAEGYAFGAVVLGAHSVGAPHIRQRLYFVAHTDERLGGQGRALDGRRHSGGDAEQGAVFGGRGVSGLVGNADDAGPQGRGLLPGEECGQWSPGGAITHGFWSDAEWIPCTDGKLRPVEPGTFPLAHGATARVGFVCAACLQMAEEEPNNEDMRALRQVAVAQDWRLAAEVLRSGVHGGCVHEEASHQGARQMAGAAFLSEHEVRALRGGATGTASTPQGRGSDEQLAGQHPDPLPRLSQRGAPGACEICGGCAEVFAVKILGNRVGRLRAYGNALCAETAVTFIRAVMEGAP